jgi:hypothetical protein
MDAEKGCEFNPFVIFRPRLLASPAAAERGEQILQKSPD